MLDGSGYEVLKPDELFDVIVLSLPYWNRVAFSPLEQACFDEGYAFLDAAICGAKSRLASTGHVFVIFSDQGDVCHLINTIHANGLRLDRFLMQRPTMVGGHVRVFLDLI